MLIQLDPGSPVALFAQIASAVRRQIADGTIGAGDRLPAARELAASLNVNMHTVLRAYQMLRDEGLVDMRRSRGAVVTDEAPDQAHLLNLATELVDAARAEGLSDDDIVALVRAQL